MNENRLARFVSFQQWPGDEKPVIRDELRIRRSAVTI